MVRSSSYSAILLVPLSGALWMRNETINGCDGERLVLLLPACVQFLLFCFVLFCFYFCIRLLVERIFAAFYLTRDITSLIEKQIVNSLCLQETILLIIYYGGTYITFSCVLCFLQPWVFSLIMSSIKRLFEWIGAFSLLTFILEKTASSYGGKAFELLLTY